MTIKQDQVLYQVRDQLWEQVSWPVQVQVLDQVLYQVREHVELLISRQVRENSNV